MNEVMIILVCLAIGVLLRLSGRLPDNTPKVLGGWVINVALPAMALRRVHDVDVDASWVLAAATPWIGVLLAIALLLPLSRKLGWTRQRIGALLLVAGWGNTSFVGLPMIAAFAGSQWLGLGMFIDLFGSYLALSILGIAIATVCSGDAYSWRSVGMRIITFPPFIAIVIAIATNHLDRPEWLETLFSTLAATLTPLALAAVGYSLRLDHLAGRLAPLSVGLGYRLALAPAAIMAMYALLGGLDDSVARVAIFEMAMPPMLGASIIALDHDLEPDLVVLLIGIGVPLSLITAPLWWSLLT